jgi:hypothetical protein
MLRIIKTPNQIGSKPRDTAIGVYKGPQIKLMIRTLFWARQEYEKIIYVSRKMASGSMDKLPGVSNLA